MTSFPAVTSSKPVRKKEIILSACHPHLLKTALIDPNIAALFAKQPLSECYQLLTVTYQSTETIINSIYFAAIYVLFPLE